jgi:glycosyltransferase involved in cell wall biosynthesis
LPNRYYPVQRLSLEKVETYPLVSVVIPTYNRASLIQKAIGSVLAQTHTQFELIIADDGSDDETKQVVLSINDPRIIYTRLEHSGHIGNVRNAGARAGKGEWLAFLDSDDQWLPHKLETQLNALIATGKTWCYSKYELMNEQGETLPVKAGSYRPLSGWITEQVLNNDANVGISTVLVNRKAFESINGFSSDTRLRYRGDFEFVLRLSLTGEAVALPNLLVRMLEHHGRVTASLPDAYERSAIPYTIFLEQQSIQKFTRIAKRRQAYLLAEAAVHRSSIGHRRVAIGQLAKAAKDDNWRHWLSATWRSVKASVIKNNHQMNQVL